MLKLFFIFGLLQSCFCLDKNRLIIKLKENNNKININKLRLGNIKSISSIDDDLKLVVYDENINIDNIVDNINKDVNIEYVEKDV